MSWIPAAVDVKKDTVTAVVLGSLNPALLPHVVVLQIVPSNFLHSLGKHCLNFHLFNGVGGLFGLNHPADQKVFLGGHGFNSSPFGQQLFFGLRGGVFFLTFSF